MIGSGNISEIVLCVMSCLLDVVVVFVYYVLMMVCSSLNVSIVIVSLSMVKSVCSWCCNVLCVISFSIYIVCVFVVG